MFFPEGGSETSSFRWAKTYFEWDQISQNDTIFNSCSPYHTIKRNILLKYFGHFESKYRKDEDIYLNTSFHIPMYIYLYIYIYIYLSARIIQLKEEHEIRAEVIEYFSGIS